MKVTNHSIAWVRTGSTCGLLSMLFYFAAAFIPVPPLLTNLAAFGFGPLLSIGCVGLFHYLAWDNNSPRLQIATFSGIAAGIMLLLMLTVQQSIFAITGNAAKSEGSNAQLIKYIDNGLNSVHFGMDIAWDILISIATVLFGYSMLKKSAYWKITGVAGCISGVLLLSFNLYYFPTPPASVDAIDWGPLVAIWYMIVFGSVVWLLFTSKNKGNQ